MVQKRRRWGVLVAAVAAAALVAVFMVVLGNNRGPSPAAGPGSSAPATSGATTASPSPPASSPSTTSAQPPSASPAPASSAPGGGKGSDSVAKAKLAAMTLEQKVGQVLMVSSPVTGADANSLYALDTLQVGNVFMKGRSEAGVAGISAEVGSVAGHVSVARTAGVRPFVATDQEGGFVQIMRGPGFSELPQAIVQGQLPVPALLADATDWGQQLADAGVNVNLAPVLDTVPSAEFAPQNAPIGAFGREYGYTPAAVSSHGIAFAEGMAAAGVGATVKHFPGLGRVTGNTDVSAGVVDDTTVRNDPYIAPFRDAVKAGVPWLMISNASYPLIDPNAMAPFSPVIVHDMVRGDLGFKGIVVSDDICDAVQVSAVPVSKRGVEFIAAGGTMALCTNQALLPQLYQGMVEAAQNDTAFAKQVDAAALLVLVSKAAGGLID
ncbi:glycoside hydrolase family 3 N-terminal domain-containing protein [Arthrobacter sp. H35-D1]|uniref:glycoside hydrolase family 3 N-terminal domain-containing protein n=1 Tax=Arthrobacter sp. H35-D1 TaxID=3046202 RepID=UPI0024BAA237|nr:glycoside hydrolase family 3 N-terminal domain-containing protein [Arthrobacter sp. H35-D1]MDJ0313001.1 glycoside hydrolase family 3 N-terminal domain-containing protein [Arthrobacter sp. H35-D1]